jgi:hypothetical protein
MSNINTGTMEHIISLVECYQRSIDLIHKARMYEVEAQFLNREAVKDLKALRDPAVDLEALASTTIARLIAYIDTAKLHKDN